MALLVVYRVTFAPWPDVNGDFGHKNGGADIPCVNCQNVEEESLTGMSLTARMEVEDKGVTRKLCCGRT